MFRFPAMAVAYVLTFMLMMCGTVFVSYNLSAILADKQTESYVTEQYGWSAPTIERQWDFKGFVFLMTVKHGNGVLNLTYEPLRFMLHDELLNKQVLTNYRTAMKGLSSDLPNKVVLQDVGGLTTGICPGNVLSQELKSLVIVNHDIGLSKDESRQLLMSSMRTILSNLDMNYNITRVSVIYKDRYGYSKRTYDGYSGKMLLDAMESQ